MREGIASIHRIDSTDLLVSWIDPTNQRGDAHSVDGPQPHGRHRGLARGVAARPISGTADHAAAAGAGEADPEGEAVEVEGRGGGLAAVHGQVAGRGQAGAGPRPTAEARRAGGRGGRRWCSFF